jgi:hypothetical protein
MKKPHRFLLFILVSIGAVFLHPHLLTAKNNPADELVQNNKNSLCGPVCADRLKELKKGLVPFVLYLLHE